MESHRGRRTPVQRGFSLVEMMVVLSILLTATAVGFPALTKIKRRAELIGELNEATFFLRVAQREAMRMSHPVVIEINVEKRELFGFANVDGDDGREYDPIPGATFRTSDYEVGRHSLPPDLPLFLRGPRNNDAVRGFETSGSGQPILVFLPSGAVQTPGGIRMADTGLNIFELSLNTTGRIQQLKHDPAPPWGGEPGFYPNGRHRITGERLWQWY